MSELFDLLKSRLDADLLGAIAGRLGLGKDETDTAVATTLPALLGGMANHSTTAAGAHEILDQVGATGRGSSLEALLDRFRGASDDGDTQMEHRLGGMMGGGLLEGLAGRLGLGGGNVGKLLALLGPLVFGALGKIAGAGGLSRHRLTSLLSDGAGAAADAAPGGRAGIASLLGPLAGMLGIGAAGATAATAAAASSASSGASAASTSASAASAAAAAPTGSEPPPKGNKKLPWIIGGAILAILIPSLLAGRGCGKGDDGGSAPTTTATETTAATDTGATTDTGAATVAGVQFGTGADGKITLTGAVPDEATRAAVVDAATTAFGADNVVDQLTVDAGAPALDGANLGDALAALKAAGSGWSVAFGASGDVTLSGEVASEDVRQKVVAAAKDAFAPATIVDQMTVAAGAGTGTPSAADTAAVEAINKEIRLRGVTFVTGSANLTPSSQATLNRVAALLRQAPTVRAEVQGHTDNQGNAGANLALSGSRAKAVVAYLVARGIAADRLVAKGYGQTRPIASNGTEAGRAKNRRVVFKVLA